jgi:hypothetical protein
VLAFGQKLTVGLLATITLTSSVRSASAILKCILEVVFCEAVQHRPNSLLCHLNLCQNGCFQLYLQSGKQKSNVSGDCSHVVLGKKNSLVKKDV